MKKKNGKNVEFICLDCKTRELIPTDVVEFLDKSDHLGVDISYPPRFYCQNCDGVMVPIYYVSVRGRVHEYKEN